MTEPLWLDVAAPTVQLRALTWGPADAPIALCLHGFPDTAYGWRKVAPALVDAGWRVVAPFMRGYAPSSLPNHAPPAQPKLETAAREHAQAQADGKQAAASPTPFQRAQKASYRFHKIGAIVAVALPTAEAAIKSLMDSAPNKQTLLDAYSQVGAGYATAKDGTPHWCIILASPL